MQPDIKKRLETWAEFMDPKSDINFLYIVTPEDDTPRPLPYPENIDTRVEWAVNAYERQMERAEWLDDYFIPAVSPYTGTEIFAQAFGSPVHYPGDNNPFALPAVYDASDLSKIKKPDVFSSDLGRLFEIAERIRNQTGPGAIVQLPDIQSPLDIAALIWEKSRFLMAMLDEPEAALELIFMVETLLTEFLDEWFKRFGTEYIAHHPHYPMRGGFTFSEDEVGAFSPEMFEKFSLPSINRLSRRYGGCGMHCCADARHQWEGFRKIEGLRLINLTYTGKALKESAEFFKNALCHFPHYALDEEIQPRPIPGWAEAFKDTHFILHVTARDENEARSFAERLKEYSLSSGII